MSDPRLMLTAYLTNGLQPQVGEIVLGDLHKGVSENKAGDPWPGPPALPMLGREVSAGVVIRDRCRQRRQSRQMEVCQEDL